MTAVRVEFAGDDAKLAAVHERLLRDQQKLLDKYAKLGDTSKKANDDATKSAKEHADALSKAEKIIKAVATAEEVHAEALKQATELASKGMLTEEQLTRVKAKLNQELKDQTGETRRLADAEKAETQAKDKADAVTRKYLTTQEKLHADLREAKKLYAEGRISVETLTRAQQALDQEQAKTATGPNLKAMLASYVSIQTVLGLINQLASEHDAITSHALESTKALAQAQQETIKNLQGMNVIQKEELLNSVVNDIQKQTNFPDAAKLTLALGAGVSAGGSIEEVKSAVKAAAALNTLNPEGMGVAAAGAVDIARQTGIKDAEKNLGFILNLGAVSRVEDPAALNRLAGEFLGNVSKTTVGQNPEQAAKEAAALFATLNQQSNDVTGRSSSTASIQFAAYLRKFFQESGGDEAQKKLKTEQDKVETATKEYRSKQEKVSDLEGKIADNRVRRSAPEKEALQRQLERARRDVSEFDKTRLTVDASVAIAAQKITDPGTLVGRMQAIQKDPALRKAFLKEMPGEAAFKLPMENLVTAGSQEFKMFSENIPKLEFSAQAYKDAVKEANTLTSEISISAASAMGKAGLQQFERTSNAKALGAIQEIMTDTLPRVRAGGLTSMSQMATENMVFPVAKWLGADAQRFGRGSIEMLERRRGQLEFGGITATEAPQVQLINKQIEAINRILDRLEKDVAGSLKNAADANLNAANRWNAAAGNNQQNSVRAQAAKANQ